MGPNAVLLWLLHELDALDELVGAVEGDWVAGQRADDVLWAVLDAVIHAREAHTETSASGM